MEVIMNEVQVLKGLRHPYVMSAEDVFMDENHFYIIQPLCEGKDLFERIVNKYPSGYPERDAATLIANLVEGVRFLHANNIVHRDLKVCVGIHMFKCVCIHDFYLL
jgi:serine/threonine protein kinase